MFLVQIAITDKVLTGVANTVVILLWSIFANFEMFFFQFMN